MAKLTLEQVSIMTSLTPVLIIDKINWTTNQFPLPITSDGRLMWAETDIMSWIAKYRN